MMFKINSGDFSKKLEMIQGIAEKRTTMPILSHVLLKSAGKTLQLIATDLENTLSVSCDATIEEELELAVPAKLLFDVVRALDEEEISVSGTKNNRITINTGSGKFEIAGLPAGDFPRVPEFSMDEVFPVSPEDLETMISKTIFSASKDEMRKNICGVLLEKRGKENVRMVATDGHRLSFFGQKMKKVNLPGNVLIPLKVITELRKLLHFLNAKKDDAEKGKKSAKKNYVEIGCSGNFFVFSATGENIVLLSRTVEAEFPDYMQVVPSSTKNRIKLDAILLRDIIRRVSIFSTDSMKGGGKFVNLRIGNEDLVLKSMSSDVGDGQEKMPIEEYSENEPSEDDRESQLPMDIGFNFTYLQDVLEALDGAHVYLGFSGPRSPVLLVPDSDEDCVNVIMPLERPSGFKP